MKVLRRLYSVCENFVLLLQAECAAEFARRSSVWAAGSCAKEPSLAFLARSGFQETQSRSLCGFDSGAMGDAKPEKSAGLEPFRFVLHAPLLLQAPTAGRCPARQARGLSYGALRPKVQLQARRPALL